LIAYPRQVSPSRRWGWFPPATAALFFAAITVALVVLRTRFITVAGRLGVDPAEGRIFSLSVLLLAVFATWRCWREARRAAQSFRERRP
jgi:ABC-type nickel/cobalt efflux system permease component RcnA